MAKRPVEIHPVGIAARPDYLPGIIDAHRAEVGNGNFCFYSVKYYESSELYRLVIVRRAVPGYFPVSDDFFIGFRREALSMVAELNEVTGVSRAVAHGIIQSSMASVTSTMVLADPPEPGKPTPTRLESIIEYCENVAIARPGLREVMTEIIALAQGYEL